MMLSQQILRTLRCGKAAPQVLMFQRSIHGTTASCSRTGSHMIEHEPEKIEAAKQKALKGESENVMPGVSGWSHALASASEAAVKAERMSNDISVEDLQKFTVDVVQKVHNEDSKEKTMHPDVSGQPGIKANMEASRSDPAKKGHGAM